MRERTLYFLLAVQAGMASAHGAASLTTLVAFDNNNGYEPTAGLFKDAGGTIYGTASGFFSITETKNAITYTLLNSNQNNRGFGDVAEDASGNLFAVSEIDGNRSDGLLFELPKGASTSVAVYNFNTSQASPVGGYPVSNLIADSAGNLYGTTTIGGLNNGGAIYELPKGSTTPTAIVTFNSFNGFSPRGTLTEDAAGNVFGVTNKGGLDAVGSLFEFNANTHVFTTLASFSTSASFDSPVSGLVEDARGNLYGISGSNTIYKYDSTTHLLSSVAVLPGTAGGGLTIDAAGDLFGTESTSFTSSYGSVYELPAGATSVITLHDFHQMDGSTPIGDLVADGAGNLFGVTARGTANNFGSVFELSNTGFVVPEPTSLLLLNLPVALLFRRPRRRASPRNGIPRHW